MLSFNSFITFYKSFLKILSKGAQKKKREKKMWLKGVLLCNFLSKVKPKIVQNKRIINYKS